MFFFLSVYDISNELTFLHTDKDAESL